MGCAGVTLGGTSAMQSYLRLMQQEFVRTRRPEAQFYESCRRSKGADQGIHQVVVHSLLPERGDTAVHVVNGEDGAITHALAPVGNNGVMDWVRQDGMGRLLNREGRPW